MQMVVLHWFQVAKRIGVEATLNVTVTKKNYDELFQTISLGLINGAHDILFNRFYQEVEGLALWTSFVLHQSR